MSDAMDEYIKEEHPDQNVDDNCEAAQEDALRCTGAVDVNSETLALFRMVFEATQKPNDQTAEMQTKLTWVLVAVLCVQVAWTLVLIPVILYNQTAAGTSTMTFASLLITAILAEVVAMAFVVVKFVFRTPLDTMIDLLKDIINKKK